MVSSFMSYKILIRKHLNYIIFAPIIIEGQKIPFGVEGFSTEAVRFFYFTTISSSHRVVGRGDAASCVTTMRELALRTMSCAILASALRGG